MANSKFRKFEVGCKVKLTGKFLKYTGQGRGAAGLSVWTVTAIDGSVKALHALMLTLTVVLAVLAVARPARATTPEQDAQAARRRMAEVCQGLLMDRVVDVCTVDMLLPRGVRR